MNLFNQKNMYCNQNDKIFHLASCTSLQPSILISMSEPSNSVPGSSDRHTQLLTAGNFANNLKLGQNFGTCYVL